MNTTECRTYVTVETARACAEFGAVHLVRTDTIFADRVEWTVKGTSDGEYINLSGARSHELALPLNWETIHTARVSSGWRLVAQ